MKRILIDDRTGLIVNEKKLKAGRRWRLAAAIILTAVFSMLPDLHMERYLGWEYTFWFDTMQHAAYYFLLTLFLFYLLPNEKRDISFLVSIFFVSVLFEFIQVLIPGRSFSILDITGNFFGITAAFILKYLQASLKES